jgi:hypothetical protein
MCITIILLKFSSLMTGRVYGVLMMVYSTQCCWVFGIFQIPIFRKLDLFPSSGEGGGGKKTPTQLGPLERANLTYWTAPVRFTQLFNHLRCRIILWEITRNSAIKVVVKHAHAWNSDRKGSRNLCHNHNQQSQVHEQQCNETGKKL